MVGTICNLIGLYREFGVFGLFLDSDSILSLLALFHQRICLVGLVILLIGLYFVFSHKV